MTDETENPEPMDPAAAFEELRKTVSSEAEYLRSEMVVIRKGLEAAFENFDSVQQPIDYSKDIENLNVAVGAVGDALERLIEYPVFGQSPAYISRKIEAAGEGLVRAASDELNKQSLELERVTKNLAKISRNARTKQAQTHWLMGALTLGLCLGIAAGIRIASQYQLFW